MANDDQSIAAQKIAARNRSPHLCRWLHDVRPIPLVRLIRHRAPLAFSWSHTL